MDPKTNNRRRLHQSGPRTDGTCAVSLPRLRTAVVYVALLGSAVALAGAPSPQQQREQRQRVLTAGDPERPAGMESLHAFILVPIGEQADVQLTGLVDGVEFDIEGEGRRERTAWTRAGTEVAFLFLDSNSDGQVTSGRELIGGGTTPEAWNGFMALRLLEPAAGGAITAEHRLYSRLQLWVDRNHNGRSERSELRPIRLVFQQIGLGYFVPKDRERSDAHGNVFRYQGWLQKTGAPAESLTEGFCPAYDVVLQVGGQVSLRRH